jgi:hypothetical protein
MNDKELEVDIGTQELIELQKTLEQFNDYVNALESGTYSGKVACKVADMRKFFKDLYAQTYEKFVNHPKYIEMMGSNS